MKPTSLRYKLLVIFSLAAISATLSSCSDNDDTSGVPPTAKQTVLMYMPWSGSGIYPYFLKNITSFETAIENNRGLGGNALVVFISENSTTSHLININYEHGECVRDTLKTYSFTECNYTTASGIAAVINDAKLAAPAEKYAMAIGCHGMGWIPAGTNVAARSRTAAMQRKNVHQTRYFGDTSNSNYQTDVTTLAEGVTLSGTKMQYILFDDCYMSNIETAYDLRGATDYLIASTCEIMIEGMPYAEIGIDLLTNNYEGVVDGFYEFYSKFSTPCGTIGVTDCREVEQMADIVRLINTAFPAGVNDLGNLQKLDGYTPTIFYDFGDYVSSLCQDQSLLATFNDQLGKLVPYKAATKTYYSMLTGNQTKIKTFSGLTISDPTTNKYVIREKTQTNWYKVTH